MRDVTLCFCMKENKVLLSKKKRSFGGGKWNGYGGKCEPGEAIEQSLVREIREEADISVSEKDLEKIGTIDFYFDDKAEWNQRAHVYRLFMWDGEPKETEEMEQPEWFRYSEIPWHEMWAGDDEWIPYVLRGEYFEGVVHFVEEGKKIASIDLQKAL